MGRRRADSSAEGYSAQERATAAEIAAMLLAGATVSSVALALVELLPVGLAGDDGLAGDVLEGVARRVLIGLPDESNFGSVGPVEQSARTERLVRRGFYAVAALRRVAGAALRGGPSGLSKQLSLERSYLSGHVRQGDRLVEGARQIDVVRDLYGDVAGWYHLNPTLDPRPHHLRAHGKNFRIDGLLPPIETGAWPATELYCGCVAGPPHRDAELMLAA